MADTEGVLERLAVYMRETERAFVIDWWHPDRYESGEAEQWHVYAADGEKTDGSGPTIVEAIEAALDRAPSPG